MSDKETKTEKHEETKKSEINALRSLEAFMEVANQHRPYEPWDFKKESYIPDLMLALLIATNLAIGTPSGKLPARLDTKNKTEERALTKLYQNMQNNKAIMFDSSKVL